MGPPPPSKRLTPEERARLVHLLDALDDAVLFTPDRDRLTPSLGRCRLGARAGALRCSLVRPPAELLDRHGSAEPESGEAGSDERRDGEAPSRAAREMSPSAPRPAARAVLSPAVRHRPMVPRLRSALPSAALVALVALVSLAALPGCDQVTEPAPPALVAGVYEGAVRDGRAQVHLLVRLGADETGAASVITGTCRLAVFDGGLGCSGTCDLAAPIRPTAEGRARFTLLSEPDFASGFNQDAGEATATFDHAVSADAQRLVGTADFACSYNDGTAERTLSYSDLPFLLARQAGVE